eukprot:2964272-Lingulodinium_polyedra.AAC.1
MKRLVALPGVTEVISHQCMQGLRHANGKQIKEPTWRATASPEIAAELDVRCDHGHAHEHCLGGRAARDAG